MYKFMFSDYLQFPLFYFVKNSYVLETPVKNTNNDQQKIKFNAAPKVILISLALRYGCARVITYKPKKSEEGIYTKKTSFYE